MADIDLATILADGEYLKRAGDTLVGDIPEAGGAGGSTILDGTGPPDIALGAVGNYYEDTTNGVLYGPKVSASWGAQRRPTIAGAAATDSGLMTRVVPVTCSPGPGGWSAYVTAVSVIGVAVDIESVAGLDVHQDRRGRRHPVDDRDIHRHVPDPGAVSGGETLTFTYASATSLPRNTTPQTVTPTTDVSFVEYRANATLDVYPSTCRPSPTSSSRSRVQPGVAGHRPHRRLGPDRHRPRVGRHRRTHLRRRLPAVLHRVRNCRPYHVDVDRPRSARRHVGGQHADHARRPRHHRSRRGGADRRSGFRHHVHRRHRRRRQTQIAHRHRAPITLPSAGPTAGQRVDFVCVGGAATFTLGAGATWHVNPTPSAVARAVGSFVSAVKMGATTWAITGDLA